MIRPYFTGNGLVHGAFQRAPQTTLGLPDHVLLQVCGASPDEAHPEWMGDLRSVSGLLAGRAPGTRPQLELAVTMLASLLGQLPRHNPTHLPFGYSGPQLKSHGWIDRDTLDRIGKQIVGLAMADRAPDAVAFDVERAIIDAIRLGFLDRQRYDAWRPGMRSGSGWRTAVMATPYGVMKARAASATTSSAHNDSPVDQPDVTTASAPVEPPESNNSAPVSVEAPSEAPVAAATAIPIPESDQIATPSTDDRYAWARQTELVNATNQVLGEGMLNKGVLSRACQSKRVQTNGKPGRASRASVTSFLAWTIRQFNIAVNEQTQIRNAIIGEINARNS